MGCIYVAGLDGRLCDRGGGLSVPPGEHLVCRRQFGIHGGSGTVILSGKPVIGILGEYDALSGLSQEQAKQMVTKETIYLEAKRQCQEMVENTQNRIAELKKASNAYMDDALRRTEEAIALSLGEVRETRVKFRALTADKSEGAADIDI